ncbi:thymidylate kinase [Thermosyntropha lipolytica DSM 11003]|uniref:Thymidylate kinase n=2 Tax=Thermosyntropha TaxID=54293 RepID=A0A1M5JM50_9FIRM|nr:dTMP kinase [Thermosyntropha lipolytica]SHG41662.1 thymidylate kinase [Thermosyntropha lipolytica DSM 11003]
MMGVFISIEGIDGSGKSSIKEGILSFLQDYNPVGVREPGGTFISEKIRELLLDFKNSSITPRTEAFLYASSRSQLVDEVIRPALEAGKIVVADRYIDSTLAYQGYGRGLDLEFLEMLNQLCTGGLKPDLTILLDIDPEIGIKRRRGKKEDRLEGEGLPFQEKVRAGYLELARREPERIKVIDAGRSLEEVLNDALAAVSLFLQGSGLNEDRAR